ncbi:MAG: WD40 repeat domain-containing protein [Chloroflexi bacterium]|nr:WD40 repeat domain-containing protein [Chloroflexota bacterium]
MFTQLRLCLVLMMVLAIALPASVGIAQDPVTVYAVINHANATQLTPVAELKGHVTTVVSLAFSSDGRLLASASQDSTARIWNVETMEEVVVLAGHEDNVNQIAFSPDNAQVATVSADKTVRIWDVTTGEAIHVLSDHNREVISLAYSADGAYLATVGADQVVRIRDTATAEVVNTLEVQATDSVTNVVGFAYSPDDSRLVTGTGTIRAGNYDTAGDRQIDIWDAATGTHLNQMTGHTDTIFSVMYSPDGKWIASGSKDTTVGLWDAETGELVHLIDAHEREVHRSIGFSPDSSLLATASQDKTLRLWDVETGEQVASFEDRTLIDSMAFSPVGNLIATGNILGSITVWAVDETIDPDVMQTDRAAFAKITTDNAGQVRALATLEAHQTTVSDLDFSPDGTQLVSVGFDASAYIWDVANQEIAFELVGHEDQVNQAVFSPDGTLVATSSRDETARLWDTATGEERFVLDGHEDRVVGLAFSPDGSRLVTTSDDTTVRVWDTQSGEALFVFEGISESVTNFAAGIAYTADGKYIATAAGHLWNITGEGFSVDLWDAATGEHYMNFGRYDQALYTLGLSPDGSQVYSTGKDRLIHVWDVQSGEEVLTLEGHTGELRHGVVFSSDGNLIVSAGFDKTVRMWSAETGDLVATIPSERDFVTSLAINNDGTIIATGNLDGSLKLWAVDPDAEFLASTTDSEEAEQTTDETASDTVTIEDVELGTIEVGQQIAGAVSSNERRLISFNGTAGQQITISNNSFAVFIEVYDDTTGELLVERTDAAMIEGIELPSDGTYTIVLTTDSRGNFFIQIRE